MATVIGISGISKQQFDEAGTSLSTMSEIAGVSLRFLWDDSSEQLVVECPSDDLDEAGTNRIIELVLDAILRDGIDSASANESHTLTWNKQYKWWDAPQLHLSSKTIPVCIVAPSDFTATEVGRSTYAFVANYLAELDDKWKAYAADELLDDYNRSWSNGQHLTREAFCHQIGLDSVAIDETGRVSAYYSAAGLFGHNGIVVELEESGSLAYVRLD